MSDLIDRQAAIDICRAPHMRNADCSDFEMAIMMLPPANNSEIPNSSDTISRQAAIEALRAMQTYKLFAGDDMLLIDQAGAQTELMMLPPAQPEIIQCTECKHYREYDSKYVENAVVVQCMADRYPISETIPDGWFCAGAERKDDE